MTIDQETFGGTIAHFPRGKLVMTQPAQLPIVGRMNFRDVSKESLLAFWESARRQAGIEIHYEQRLESLESHQDGFQAKTTAGIVSTRAVLLAIGRRGTPRQLGVPGEEQAKVVYRLVDPDQFAGHSVLVVGGGDSALEAAATLAEETDAMVCLSYRGDAFQRAKRRNRKRIDEASQRGRLRVELNSEIISIARTTVSLKTQRGQLDLPNDDVIVCAGGILPTPFLKTLGIETVTKHGEA
jgi:thioredoxin reductase (NADPH)